MSLLSDLSGMIIELQNPISALLLTHVNKFIYFLPVAISVAIRSRAYILYKVRKIPGERYPEKESAPDKNAQRNT